jgi:hypothetical protein
VQVGAVVFGWDAVSALATLASTIVVAVAAVAAILQIRHLRAANQLEAILRMYERFDGPEMVEARRFCLEELPALIERPEERRAMVAGSMDPRVLLLTSFYTEIGALVNDGFLEDQLINRLGTSIARTWSVLAPLAYELRETREEPMWAGFEYIAALQARQTQARRLGRYPKWFQARVRAEEQARKRKAEEGP